MGIQDREVFYWLCFRIETEMRTEIFWPKQKWVTTSRNKDSKRFHVTRLEHKEYGRDEKDMLVQFFKRNNISRDNLVFIQEKTGM